MSTSDLIDRSSDELNMFTKHLEAHLTARLYLESSISKVLQALSPHPQNTMSSDHVSLVSDLNIMLTDYVANSQLVILPFAQNLRPQAMSTEEKESAIDNAVGISYISNVVSTLENSTTACSIFLSLFADRLQIENQLFQSLKARKQQTVEIGYAHHPKSLVTIDNANTRRPRF